MSSKRIVRVLELLLGKEKLERRAGRREGKPRKAWVYLTHEAWVYLTYEPKDDTLTIETSWLPRSVGRKLPGFMEQADGTYARAFRGEEHRDKVGLLRVITKVYALVFR